MKPLSIPGYLAVALAFASLRLGSALGAEPSAPSADAAQPAEQSAPADPAAVEFFEKKVRPLLASRCQECHGPTKQKGNLRLDSRAAVLRGGDTGPAVVPQMPDESLLVDAIRYGDMYQMPPKSQLPAEEIATLVEWVRLGVPWGRVTAAPAEGAKPGGVFDLASRAGHWSFQPVKSLAPPEVANASWVSTPIDRFILARLEAAGIEPAPRAERRALLRRVTYDLIGLPPTPAEVEAFVADPSPLAYETVVDRLLASPHYGERWARHWLDLVRYAETYGHEFDYDMPNAYRYRDYVIRALNDDLPYDQFVVEQVAGDLVDPPRRRAGDGANESIIATGCFLFGEAKHSPVDVRQDEADRIDNQIDVFAKTFLGLTVSCARCHDHKFDAISTNDYYALAGYLQSSRYQQAYIDPPETLAGPLAALEKLRDQRKTACADFVRAAIVPHLKQLSATLAGSSESWNKYLDDSARAHVNDPLHAWAVLARPGTDSSQPAAGGDFQARRAQLAVQFKQQLAASSAAPVPADIAADGLGDWKASGAAFGDSAANPLDWVFTSPAGRVPRRPLGGSVAHSGLLSAKLQGVLRSPTFEIPKAKILYRLRGSGGHVRLIVDGLQLIKDPIYGGLRFEPGSTEPHWHGQDVSKWIGHRAYIELVDDGDGYLALEQVAFTDGAAPEPKPNRLVAAILEDPSLATAEQLAEKYQALFGEVVSAWLNDPQAQPADAADRAAILDTILAAPWLDAASLDSPVATFKARLAELDEHAPQIESQIAPPRQAMALADGTAENEHVFIRGSHKTLGEEVPRRFLEVMGGKRFTPPVLGSGRLELARQIASPDNPLIARVIVNRLWHHHFGAGIVRSVDDFGVMGQPPTHPELLDYLAGELVREHWSLKQMHRLMVLSSTYRMSSAPRADADRIDPQNALWHRMQVRRLEAECIRDAMLAVSGRADPTMYGPSVMPHLNEFMTGRGKPTTSGPLDGDGRRSIYLAVRRNFIAPMFLAFDYPIPFTTIGRRGTSNVPAQALAMMNNPFVVEQARQWARRVIDSPNADPALRVREMYLTALGRPPEDAERQAALAFLAGQGGGDPAAGGQSSIAPDEQTWADFAHVLLNLKEFIFIP